MDSLYIVMPAYNEEENIENVIKEWYPKLEGKAENSRLVVADKGSIDKTREKLEMLKQNGYSQLEIYDTEMKQHGPKLIGLYEYAISQNADFIFQTDSDGQTQAFEFDEFWAKRDMYDCIIGNRAAREDGKDRVFVEKVVCILCRFIFGVRIPDANAPFRLMKADVVRRYINRIPNDYNIPNIILTVYFAFYKEKMLFKDITFKKRQKGENSIDIIKIIGIGFRAIFEFYGFRKEMNRKNA